MGLMGAQASSTGPEQGYKDSSEALPVYLFPPFRLPEHHCSGQLLGSRLLLPRGCERHEHVSYARPDGPRSGA